MWFDYLMPIFILYGLGKYIWKTKMTSLGLVWFFSRSLFKRPGWGGTSWISENMQEEGLLQWSPPVQSTSSLPLSPQSHWNWAPWGCWAMFWSLWRDVKKRKLEISFVLYLFSRRGFYGMRCWTQASPQDGTSDFDFFVPSAYLLKLLTPRKSLQAVFHGFMDFLT